MENLVQNSFWNWVSIARVVTTSIRLARPRSASSEVMRPASSVLPRPTSSAIRSRTRSCERARSTGKCWKVRSSIAARPSVSGRRVVVGVAWKAAAKCSFVSMRPELTGPLRDRERVHPFRGPRQIGPLCHEPALTNLDNVLRGSRASTSMSPAPSRWLSEVGLRRLVSGLIVRSQYKCLVSNGHTAIASLFIRTIC